MRVPSPAAALLVVLLLESVAVKSVVFDRNDPIAFHYLFSGVAIGMLLLYAALHPWLTSVVRRTAGALSFVLLAMWLVLATISRPNAFETAAAIGFLLLVLFFYFTMPRLCLSMGVSIRRLLVYGLLACAAASAVVLVAFPAVAFEEPSLRFRGALISVAVACNVFCFACIYAVWAWKHSAGAKRWLFAAGALLSFVLLLMTFTKSSIAQAALGSAILLVTSKLGAIVWSRALVVGAMLVSLPLAALPFVDLEATFEALRIIDNDVLASRGSNWEQGLDRALENPILGTGLLTKQTQGGSTGVELSSDAYDSSFDAHSLGISLMEQAGLPFMLLFTVVLFAPMVAFVREFGMRQALQTPEFLISAIVIPGMMLAGGDMVSLGSLINRLQWLFLGILAFEALHHRRSRREAATRSMPGFAPRIPVPPAN